MQLYKCQHCEQLLYFENDHCEVCHRNLGYLSQQAVLSALDQDGETWLTLAKPRRTMRFCSNHDAGACNWLIPADSEQTLCAACRHNRTVPDLSDAENLVRWRNFELAKHRLFYGLLRLRLPLINRVDDPEHGLAFDFLADAPEVPAILTGHENGLITFNLKEADDAERERIRTLFGEPYRTLLGHFRHEIGHYFWDVLIRDGGQLESCRALFGDETADYEASLRTYYEQGAPPDWQNHFISAYATSHPWEDFAESWAHYLHIVDTLETAHAFSLRIRPRVVKTPELQAAVDFDPYQAADFATIIEAWLPLTFAMNSLSRSMGQNDLYPFILSSPAIEKLGFIHDLVHRAAKDQQIRATG